MITFHKKTIRKIFISHRDYGDVKHFKLQSRVLVGGFTKYYTIGFLLDILAYCSFLIKNLCIHRKIKASSEEYRFVRFET